MQNDFWCILLKHNNTLITVLLLKEIRGGSGSVSGGKCAVNFVSLFEVDGKGC